MKRTTYFRFGESVIASRRFAAIALAAALLVGIPTAQACGPYCDLQGGDKAAYYMDNAMACEWTCDRTNYCRGWTWVKPGVQGPKAVCYLKATLMPAKRSSCCISGYRGDHTAAASVRQFRFDVGGQVQVPPAQPRAQGTIDVLPPCNCVDQQGHHYRDNLGAGCGPSRTLLATDKCVVR